jgi:hypothetical protein
MSERTPGASVSITDHKGGMAMGRVPRRCQHHFGDKLPGRPTHTAELAMPKTSRQIKRLYNRYYKILRALHYGEAQALCRGLKCSYSTFLMRKYEHRRPKLEEVIAVVTWDKSGRPTVANKRRLTRALLFGIGP